LQEYGILPNSYVRYQPKDEMMMFGYTNDRYIFELTLNDLYDCYPEMKIINNEVYDYNNNCILSFLLKNGLIMTIYGCNRRNLEDFEGDGFELTDGDVFSFDNFKLLYLPEFSDEISQIFNMMERRKLIYQDKKGTCIGIISRDDEGYNIKKIDIGNKIKICTNQDLHYGVGFEVFYRKLINQLKNNGKGLVLFYGAPGTGKTYCIRNIINDLCDDKFFVYAPSDMILNILEPGFISFLTNYIIDFDKKSIVLIVEDAESLIKDRNENGNIGISNLLNMTDGLLNDILGLQVIATFNMEIEYLDKALLRNGRLIAQKEFTNLSIEDVKKLKTYIGINGEVDREMSLAEIYSLKMETEILQHNIKPKLEKSIGFLN
jgi:hypothetical protein